LAAEYRAAGFDYAPPGLPLESIDELKRVRGMTAGLLAALRPHLSLFSPATPNPASVDPFVTAAIAFAGDDAVTTGASAPDDGNQLVTARILATADGPGNAKATRSAIVRVGPFTAMRYSLLSWENGLE
jgi:general secretion pathway protein K